MLEIIPTEAAIMACHGDGAALDGLPEALGLVMRVAPDEAWLVVTRERRLPALQSASAWLASADPAGIVVDQTDGWSMFALRGDDLLDVFGRLSVAEVPSERPVLVQGALSGVPGKAWFTPDGVCLIVPSPVGHHLLARLRATCDDLTPTFAAAAPFDPATGKVGA